MRVCGPKYAICGIIISAWGIVQLGVMGIFFILNSVALIEDIQLEETYSTLDEFSEAYHRGYRSNAYNCWIAAAIYVLTLLFSIWQFYLNSKNSS